MTDKVYKDVLPCGVLPTRTGKEYWLIKPYPLLKDWEQDRQQRFLVVPKEELDVENLDGVFHSVYSYQRHLITTDPDIEYFFKIDSIKVWNLDEYDVVDAEWPLQTKDKDEPIPVDVLDLIKTDFAGLGV